MSKDRAYGRGDSSMGTTRGSETSQYPEEKKSNEIPLVVASERGISLNRIDLSMRCCRAHPVLEPGS